MVGLGMTMMEGVSLGTFLHLLLSVCFLVLKPQALQKEKKNKSWVGKPRITHALSTEYNWT